jgi:UDP-N-acetylmuramate dehydrogenase
MKISEFEIITWFGNKVRFNNCLVPLTIKQLTCHLISEKYESIKVFGATSNVLFKNKYYIENIIITSHMIDEVDFHSGWVSCGTKTSVLSKLCASRSIIGFEGVEGIPGCLGGAVTMNASAYGCCISDNIISVEIFNISNSKIEILSWGDCFFTERSSIFLNNSNYIVLRILFRFNKGDINIIRRKRYIFHKLRHMYSDYSLPSLGSLFVLSNRDLNFIFLKNRKKNFIFVLRYFIYILFNFKYLRVINRGTLISLFHQLFYKDIESGGYSLKYASFDSLNSILNSNNEIDSIVEYIDYLKNKHPNLKLENQIY